MYRKQWVRPICCGRTEWGTDSEWVCLPSGPGHSEHRKTIYMADVYLRPQDVSQADAQEVLDFLNAAETAEEIAEAVEIPGEPDVGIRVAQRVLNRRNELGGFTDLQQVADVPQVGPERFTEIVVTLSGASFPQRTELTSALYVQLLREIRALRETMESLTALSQARHRVTLRPVQTRPFLGQPVTIVATVTDHEGRPQANVPITFVTMWGRLQKFEPYAVRQGTNVAACTGINGTAEVTLLPPASEDLTEGQQGALETMLRFLNSDATSPREIEAGFKAMARQYRWDVNIRFRRAVDVYFRDFRGQLVGTINQSDFMASWSYFEATVMAFVREREHEGESSVVRSAASLSVQFKDWLGPWLQAYLSLVDSESTLGVTLQQVKQTNGEPGELLDGIYRTVCDFVGKERGLAGEYVGQKVAETSISHFMATEMASLPLDSVAVMFPALKTTSAILATTGISVMSALGQTHAELRNDINTKVTQVQAEGIAKLAEQVGNIQSQLDAKINRSEVNTALAGKLDSATFEEFQVQVNNSLESKVDTATFTQFQANVNSSLGSKVNSASFNEFSSSVNSNINKLTEKVEDVESQVAAKVDSSLFNDALAGKVDATEFSQFQTRVNNSLMGKVNTATYNQLSKTINSKIESLGSKVTDLEKRVVTPIR